MNKRIPFTYVAFSILFIIYAFSSLPPISPSGHTGAPTDGNCTDCHNFPLDFEGDIAVSGLPSIITPNTNYTITVTTSVTSGAPVRAGFQTLVLNESNSNAGDFSSADPNSTVQEHNSGRAYWGHQNAQNFNGSSSVSWTTDWTSPSGPMGETITFYTNAILGNGIGSAEDVMVSNVLTGVLGMAGTLDVQIVSTTNVTCFGDTNGATTAQVNNGSGNYEFMWSNGQMGVTVSNLAAGDYTVTVTDLDDGATGTATATINQPPAIVVTTSKMDITCFGAMNGTASANAVGGTGMLTFNWDNGETGQTIQNLGVGDFLVQVTDENFCSESAIVTITQPPAIDLTISTTPETGNNTNDGSASAEVMGGTGNITYLWSTGATTEIIQSLPPGDYCVTATDDNGCFASACAVVEEFGCSDVQTVVNTTMVDCFGNATGQAVASSFNGTPPYSYAWSNGDLDDTAENLTAGVYSVTCTDALGCSASLNAIITEPGQLSLEVINFGAPPCDDTDSGFASVAASGGILGYSYLWSNGDTTSMVTGLASGNYTATVTDPNFCTATTSVEIITQPDTLPPTPAVNNINVFLNENGFASITPDMINAGSMDDCGIASIEINVTDFDCTNFGSNEVEMTVQDISGLTASIISFVMVIDSIQPEISCPPNMVMEGCNLIVEYDVPTVSDNCGAGTPFFLEGIPSGGTFPAGETTVIWGVNDDFGNPGLCEFTVTLENDFAATAEATSTSCIGFSDGTATAAPLNGVPPFTYAWNAPNNQETPTAVGLNGGEYIVTITDSEGCGAATTIVVPEPDLITIEVIDVVDETNTDSNGAITIEANGGSGTGFTFEWFLNGDFFSNDMNLTDLSAGTYVVFVQDLSECTNSDTIVVDMIVPTLEEDLATPVSVFPNPSSGQFWVHVGLVEAREVSFGVFDLTGKLLLENRNPQLSDGTVALDLSNFSTGVYYLKIQIGASIVVRKIVLE